MRISDWSSDVCASDLDAKRGDIGNTSLMYARAFFAQEGSGLNFDAVTVAPYMGIDSVTPFLGFDGKWAILLALNSNQGNQDFQYLETKEIDRASCRERVGQYVEISVAGGSLKK